MELETVRYKELATVARITLNRPRVMSVLSHQLRDELMQDASVNGSRGGGA